MTTWHARDVVRLACLVAIVLAVVGLTVQGPAPGITAPLAPPTPSNAEPTSPAEHDRATVAAEQAEDRTRARLQQISEDSHFAVSLRDQATGTQFDYGSARFPTASLVKIHFVALMLWRADRTGESLSAAQRSDAEQMLIRSDNDSANRAYTALGGPAGIEDGLEKAFGSSRIEVGEGFRWGHSLTRPRAIVHLLGQVLDTEGDTPFELMHDAMSRVIPEQRWGVTALADKRSTVQVKVGWVQESGGWVVNSSGRVLVDDQPVLISVMTDRNTSLDDGIATIEEVARLVGDVVRTRREAQQSALPLPSSP